MDGVRGYKVFNSDWTCDPTGRNPKQYSCPGKFEENVDLSVCHCGMHFCENASDCFNYYKFDSDNKVAEVIAYGDVLKNGNKSCTDKLEIVREIPWQELLTIVNTGKDCTGLCNTGDWNTGDWNNSSFNTGCFNTEEQKIMMFNKPSDTPYMAWEAWEHIRRLTCLVCGVRYVRQLEGNPDAERICDEICQKIYDLRMSVGENNEIQTEQ